MGGVEWEVWSVRCGMGGVLWCCVVWSGVVTSRIGAHLLTTFFWLTTFFLDGPAGLGVDPEGACANSSCIG